MSIFPFPGASKNCLRLTKLTKLFIELKWENGYVHTPHMSIQHITFRRLLCFDYSCLATTHSAPTKHFPYNIQLIHIAIRFKSLIYEIRWLHLQWNCITRHDTIQINKCQRACNSIYDNWFGFFELFCWRTISIFWFAWTRIITVTDKMDDGFEVTNSYATFLNLVSSSNC